MILSMKFLVPLQECARVEATYSDDEKSPQALGYDMDLQSTLDRELANQTDRASNRPSAMDASEEDLSQVLAHL